MQKTLNHIMCVDDDPDILQLLKMSLEIVANYKVTIFDNGHHAIEQILDIKPDLILLDVMMPVIDGPQLLKALQEKLGADEIPMVFMTARAQPNEINDYIELGAISVLVKPFDPMQLPQQIEKVWRQFYENGI